MSNTFSDREKGFERKYEMDQDRRFRIQSRRDKLFGQWLAGLLGLSDAQVETYAQEVVASNFEKPGDDDMLEKVRKDLQAKKTALPDAELLKKLREFELAATEQIAG